MTLERIAARAFVLWNRTGFCIVPTKEPLNIEVIQEGEERYVLKTFADGSEKRIPVVKAPRRPSRFPYRKWSFDKSKRKGF